MYPIAWLLLLAPLLITLSAIVGAVTLVVYCFGWKVALAAFLFATAATWSFGRGK